MSNEEIELETPKIIDPMFRKFLVHAYGERVLELIPEQKEQLFNMPKPDQSMAEELVGNIKSANIQIIARHQGKEMFTAWIHNFDQEFNSIDWKNSSIARSEIDRGLQLVNNGADKGALGSAVQSIVAQMKDPDVLSGGSGVSTGK